MHNIQLNYGILLPRAAVDSESLHGFKKLTNKAMGRKSLASCEYKDITFGQLALDLHVSEGYKSIWKKYCMLILF